MFFLQICHSSSITSFMYIKRCVTTVYSSVDCYSLTSGIHLPLNSYLYEVKGLSTKAIKWRNLINWYINHIDNGLALQ